MSKFPTFPTVPTATADDRTMYQLSLLPDVSRFNENDKYNAEREKMRSHLNCIINVNQTRQKKNWTPLIPFTKHEKAWYDGLKLKDMIPSPPSGSSVPRGGSTKKRRNRRYSRKEKRR
jgi:hypothetical protein